MAGWLVGSIREGGSGKATIFIGPSYVVRPVTSTVNRLHEFHSRIEHVLQRIYGRIRREFVLKQHICVESSQPAW